MRTVSGVSDLGLFRVIGHRQSGVRGEPQAKAARYQAEMLPTYRMQCETAMGGKAVSQVLQGE